MNIDNASSVDGKEKLTLTEAISLVFYDPPISRGIGKNFLI